MTERIIIEFDDEEEKSAPGKDESKIIIDFEEEKKSIDADSSEESSQEKIISSKISSFYRGDAGLSNSFNTVIKFPEGIEQGFRKKVNINLKDEFYNSILENNKNIIVSSKSGNVFLTDRFSGKIKEKIFFENETFEKTGLVHNNVVYLNSLKKIYKLEETSEGKIKHEAVHEAANDYYIWSNLNLFRENLVFIEFNSNEKKAAIKMININDPAIVNEFNFGIKDFVSDKICIAGTSAFIMTDDNLLVYDLENLNGTFHPVNVMIDENSFIFYLNHRIYITTLYNELYYLDIPAFTYRLKNTGIKNNYINSIGGFDDNIFVGTLDGWKCYKSSGLQIYNFEDEYENKIECISKNVLTVSQKNKIVFYNLNRFQEAEGYVIASNEKNDSVEIVSAIFSSDAIFVLTKNGVLKAFTNDKLNIHI